ncbi:hypothetical protein PHYC_00500 [Phycisphaerales bacterium]|nr:hypothetical protein PHYC_00500 [Phycisphaerales bacterium]
MFIALSVGAMMMLGVIALCFLVPHPRMATWLFPALPFVVANTVLHMLCWAWFRWASDRQEHQSEKVARCLNSTRLRLRAETRTDLKAVFEQASGLYHQRINFSLVANAALLAGVSQVIEIRNLTCFLALAGWVTSYVAMASVWVIGARSHFAFGLLADSSPAIGSYRSAVDDRRFPSGKCLLEHLIPWMWTSAWIVIAVGAGTGAWK